MKGKRVSCMVNENLLNFELLMLILTLNWKQQTRNYSVSMSR